MFCKSLALYAGSGGDASYGGDDNSGGDAGILSNFFPELLYL